jgi:hypothetical protein
MALFAMHCIFAFATCLGFAMPLAVAGSEKRAERAEEIKRRVTALDVFGPLVDVWLLLEDAIPVFWIFQFARNAKREMPEDIREAKNRWREEPSIRLFFWISVVLFASIPIYFI